MKITTPLAIALIFAGSAAHAQDYVNGYTRSDGTQVQGYYRSAPDSTVTNNYSYEGNTNPYTGQQGHDYYHNDPSSPYYNGSTAGQ